MAIYTCSYTGGQLIPTSVIAIAILYLNEAEIKWYTVDDLPFYLAFYFYDPYTQNFL